MLPKKLLLATLAILLSSALRAQDKIYQSDGTIIDAKIKSVGVRSVTYTRFDNQSGPEYTLDKRQLEKIVYQNGGEDNFSNMPRPHHMRHRPVQTTENTTMSPKYNYAPNVLSLAPFQFTENGLGVGVTYERALDPNGYLAFYMPVIATWDLNSGTYVNAAGQTVNGKADPMFYVMPGIKLYPTGSFGQVRYSIGPSLVLAAGQSSSVNYDPYGYQTESTQSRFMLGILINNGINFNPTPHIHMGLEVGMGFTYLNRVAGLNDDTKFLAQGGFKIGYRF